MAYMSQPSSDYAGTNYLRVLIRGLGTNAISTLTIYCSNGDSYATSVEGGSTGDYRSTTKTFTGLSSGTSYGFWATGKTTGGTAISVPTSYFSTTAATPSQPSASVSVSGLSITVTVYTGSNTGSVSCTLGGNQKSANVSSNSSTTFYFTASSYDTYYSISIVSYSSSSLSGNSSSTYYTSATTDSPPTIYPTAPSVSTTVSGKSITVTVTARADTNYVECTLGSNTKSPVSLTNGNTTYFYFSVSEYSTSYSYSVTAYSTTGHTNTTSGTVTSGADNVSPTISLTSTDRYNALTINYSASDDSALRATNTFYTECSGGYTTTQSSPTYYSKGYLGQSARQANFGTDGQGNALVVGKYYYWRITVYDTAGNAASISGVLQFARTKPSSFSWTYTKTSGADFNLTASEWNSYLIRMNEFRQYKGLVNLTFTTASSGGNFTATQFNQTVNALNTMSPSISAPSTRSAGDTVYASYFNALASSLNSIS